ncbi:hypothetical protein L345_05429 [Ophiophagus hannah]|uniref:Uncharacterized protein n=1 Tax=Ophiophagus hannah TaxID=8665 RepID=V8P369_OPHHA|nr:hypothetical protein L345_05429 [Ophiophagus hannah]
MFSINLILKRGGTIHPTLYLSLGSQIQAN